ncbi:class I SAM-dependent methyltransferase [Microscilla marina]|uniref:3-demethylubiquinone-9 3-methyltransferase, putative n=1 Tax=Microscilla marina ATCC 23134 TaxID=313606 RepID=A1ZLY2_MICM2|nr:methyltransferase domain-containing protein [Microscilla marina]EAY28514.1 3-demethylubiquinone-9 3-methyltransferase, putative [Microscilla marina ATCC 23134]
MKTGNEATYPHPLLLAMLPSAQQVVPLLIQLFQPKSVVDVGCGLGIWLSVFQQEGVSSVLGIDNPAYIDLNHSVIHPKDFLAHDLQQPLAINQSYDLVMCLEVAEHLPANQANTLVQSLTRLGEIVVFSAAIPHQGGIHHVNEQWASYWVDLFAKARFTPVNCIKHSLWANDQVEHWYKQNLLVFVKNERLQHDAHLQHLKQNSLYTLQDVVHPKIWEQMIANKNAEISLLKEHIAYLKQENTGIKNAFNNLMKGVKRKLPFVKHRK